MKKFLNIALLSMILFSFCSKKNVDVTVSAKEASRDTLVYNASNGLSDNTGKIFPSLPIKMIPVIAAFNEEKIYIGTNNNGIFKIMPDGKAEIASTPDLRRRTMLDGVNEFRNITGLALSQDGKNLYVATKHSIYKSLNEGKTFDKVDLLSFDKTNLITALTVDDDGNLIIGTSYNGIYRKKNGTIERLVKGLPYEPYGPTVAFYEHVSSLYSGKDGILYAGFLFGKGIFTSKDGKNWTNAGLKLSNENSAVFQISSKNGVLYSSTSEGIFFNDSDGTWKKHSVNKEIDKIFSVPENSFVMIKNPDLPEMFVKNDRVLSHRADLDPKAAGKKALYTSVHFLKNSTSDMMKYLEQCGANAVVIDFKDDVGDIYAQIGNKTASEIGALKSPVDYKKIISDFKNKGIWTIARIVSFKDKRLYEALGNKYAVWDSAYDKPWKAANSEYWVDPYSEFVRSYLIDISNEAVSLGFDEIQYDYIRFPMDGPINRCLYRYNKNNDTYKSEILEDFLQEAKSKVKAPISVDIYGITSHYRFGDTIGQDIFVFARHADAISPMVYSSHYGPNFLNNGALAERAYRIVHHSGVRSKYLSENQAFMRPYLQAFEMATPNWGTEYINSEIKAVENSSLDGYIFWNAGVKYGMVEKAFSKKE